MPYFIASPCINVMDKSCIEECPVDCIYEGDRKLYINPGECIDCGACEPVCPESAIYVDWKAPAGMSGFVGDNAQFFTEPLPAGSPVPSGATVISIFRISSGVRARPRFGPCAA